MRQSSSDPLPYVQVDRAVEPTAALLAGHMKVTPQHAIGSLVGFWKLCGDPRELERIVEATAAGQEPEVVLTAEDVALRFQLASDCKVEPVVLARLGLLEERGDGRFRVRGMSRFFEPVVRRLVKRSVGRTGGKASAEARKAASGTAQPLPVRSGSGSDGASAVLNQPRSNPEATPKQDRSTDRSSAEDSGQRSAVSGHLFKAAAAGPMSLATPEGFWTACQDKRDAIPGMVRETPPTRLDHWFSEAMMQVNGDEQRLLAGYEQFLVDPFWRNEATRRCHWGGWVKQWRDFVSRAASPVTTKSSTKAPVAAESVDWSTVTPGEVAL